MILLVEMIAKPEGFKPSNKKRLAPRFWFGIQLLRISSRHDFHRQRVIAIANASPKSDRPLIMAQNIHRQPNALPPNVLLEDRKCRAPYADPSSIRSDEKMSKI